VRVEPEEIQPVPRHLELGGIFDTILDRNDRLDEHISNATTPQAPHVIVSPRISVKAFLAIPEIQLPDETVLRKNLKVPVHSTETDSRQPLPDPFVDFVCCRVGIDLGNLFEDDSALRRHPEAFIRVHGGGSN